MKGEGQLTGITAVVSTFTWDPGTVKDHPAGSIEPSHRSKTAILASKS